MDDCETATAAAQIMLTSPEHDDHALGHGDDVMPPLSAADDNDTQGDDDNLTSVGMERIAAVHDNSNPLHDYQPNGDHLNTASTAAIDTTAHDINLDMDTLLDTTLTDDVTMTPHDTPLSQQQQQQQVPQQQQTPPAVVPSVICCGCQQPIRDRYLLNAIDAFWHEACLKCSCCGCKLGDVGSSLYTRSSLLLCKRDYLRWVGVCTTCSWQKYDSIDDYE